MLIFILYLHSQIKTITMQTQTTLIPKLQLLKAHLKINSQLIELIELDNAAIAAAKNQAQKEQLQGELTTHNLELAESMTELLKYATSLANVNIE